MLLLLPLLLLLSPPPPPPLLLPLLLLLPLSPQLFMKRLELCDDAAAKEYLRYTNAQMLEGGFTLQAMFEG